MYIIRHPNFSWFMIVLIPFLMAGCTGGASSPGANSQIPVVEPVSELASMETYEIKTCGSTAEQRESYAVHFPLTPEIQIADQATSVASGAACPLSSAEKDLLVTQVRDAYQQVFEATEAELNKNEFVAAGDKATTFNIRLYRQKYQSTFTSPVQGEMCTISYQVEFLIPEVTGSTSADCGG